MFQEGALLRRGVQVKFCSIKSFMYCVYRFYPKATQQTAPKKTCMLVLPYLGPLSIHVNRKIKRLANKFYPHIELGIVYRGGLSIRSLFSYKDQLPLKCSSGVMYYICCKSYGPSQAYIGKTINTVHERFYGANGHLNPSTKKNALLEHLGKGISDQCEFYVNTLKIIDRCECYLKLRYDESIHLKLGNQSLNTQDRSTPHQIIYMYYIILYYCCVPILAVRKAGHLNENNFEARVLIGWLVNILWEYLLAIFVFILIRWLT